MKIGQVGKVFPSHMAGSSKNWVKGRVVWIHPEGRFFLCEWVNDKGYTMRESFFMGNKGRASKQNNRNP